MHNRHYIAFALAVLTMLGITPNLGAQSMRTEHTYKLENADSRPAASLQDVSWLAGSWSGEAFGDTFEEVWNPPSAGSMIGMFKLLKEGRVAFYELVLLVEEEGSLSLKVKHFNDDFTAWEDKEEYVDFKLVKVEKDAVHFSGLSFHRINENEIHGYLALRDGDNVWEEKLTYHRRE